MIVRKWKIGWSVLETVARLCCHDHDRRELLMCAINPKHQKHFKLSVYTSVAMAPEVFDDLVRELAFKAELQLNEYMGFRWHVEELREKRREDT